MVFPQEFNEAYWYNDELGYLQIILSNKNAKKYLWFNGMDFYGLITLNSIPLSFKECDLKTKGDSFVVESIRQSDDIFFIKLLDGDIWQIYFMLDGENIQRLSIFSKLEHGSILSPLGVSLYEAAWRRFSEAMEIEVLAVDFIE
ncbi:hypothetical protein DVR12_17655 [Chitinophaga silvatica]|uniref:Uncharacterized protein n=1 Tax=Chitinophaga silvatica TaxID=2282649 RepID=A0A3E1Y7S4_9BACT|nr:hypothetical protein [Chitinophaga silvatica]RFS21161.1 hypothetical protein DVR12_17655 [Chitinophaga silvatica]